MKPPVRGRRGGHLAARSRLPRRAAPARCVGGCSETSLTERTFEGDDTGRGACRQAPGASPTPLRHRHDLVPRSPHRRADRVSNLSKVVLQREYGRERKRRNETGGRAWEASTLPTELLPPGSGGILPRSGNWGQTARRSIEPGGAELRGVVGEDPVAAPVRGAARGGRRRPSSRRTTGPARTRSRAPGCRGVPAERPARRRRGKRRGRSAAWN